MKSNTLKTRKALEKYALATMELAEVIYSGKALKKFLYKGQPWGKIHSDALEVLKCQEKLDA